MLINYSDDLRYTDESKIVTHDLIGLECIMCKDLKDMFEHDSYKSSEVICINEGQFYDNLYHFCTESANNNNKHVYVCGLEGDFKQKPFGEMLDLIPVSEDVVRLNAFCKGCNDGTLAFFNKRICESNDTVVIGGSESYIPVCRKCLNYTIESS